MKRNEIRLVDVSDKLFAYIKAEAKKNIRTMQAQTKFMLEELLKTKK